VLSKCANPACLARFRYLHEGRIFNIEIKAASGGDFAHLNDRVEHFWLCEGCARVMKVVWENGTVTTRPRYLALPEGKRLEKPEERSEAA
jgi:hypothetical protein